MSEDTGNLSVGDLVTLGGFVLTVKAAWIFIAGWGYANTYADIFGLPMLLADTPRDFFMMYGLMTANHFLLWVVLAIITLLAILRFTRRFALGWRTIILLVCVLGLFRLAPEAGEDAAKADVAAYEADGYRKFAKVQLVLKEPREFGDAKLVKRLQGGCTKLLLARKDHVYLITPLTKRPQQTLPTDVVPWKEIRFLRMTQDRESCEK